MKEGPMTIHPRQLEICEGEFSRLLDSSPLSLWVNDTQNNCIYGNKAALDFTGYSFEELANKGWQTFIHPEDLDRVVENSRLFLISHPTLREEYRAILKNGRYAWVQQIAAPRFSPAGEFLGYLGTLTDMTEQKMREEAMAKQHRHLEEEVLKISEWERTRLGRDLHDTLSQLLLGVSLKSMLLSQRLKKRDLPEFYTAREVTAEIDKIISATRKLSQFLFPVTLTKKDFFEALRDLGDQTLALFKARLIIDFRDEMEDFEPEKALHLYRIIQEAVTNAVRHGKADRIEVLLKAETNGKRLVEIRDNGFGGPASAGQGLGLHIMEYRAKAIGGEIELKRDPKGGFVLSCQYNVLNPSCQKDADPQP